MRYAMLPCSQRRNTAAEIKVSKAARLVVAEAAILRFIAYVQLADIYKELSYVATFENTARTSSDLNYSSWHPKT